MTAKTTPWRSLVLVLFSCIFALVTGGCGGAAAAESPAKGAPYYLAEQEAAPVAADMEEAPAEAPADEEAPLEAPAPVAARVAAGRAVAKSSIAQAPPPPAPPPRPQPPGVPAAAPESPPGAEPASTPGREPLLIYTATMTLAVFETKAAIDAVEELARSRGGYLVSRSDQSVTIRVPTKAFQETLGGVSRVGDELHREVNVRDVTEQYADLEIRLKNAEAVRLRLEALLAKAGKVEDALAVERELERITRSIEQMKGRLRLLSELVAFSTITANFQARPRDQVGSETRLPFPWLGELGLVPLMNLEAP
jgi:hypothetical protein